MQLVRQGLDISRYLRGLPPEFAHTVTNFNRQIGRVLLDLFQLDGQQCETLTDVVVQLSCDTGTFLLLCLNQPAAQACKGPLRQFSLGDVDKGDHSPNNLLPSALRIRPEFSGEARTIRPP